ncbi:hypothetical protein LINPERPRIM_LOCUS32847 [Linum perenne]
MSVCSLWNVREQGRVSLLQQLENKGRRP